MSYTAQTRSTVKQVGVKPSLYNSQPELKDDVAGESSDSGSSAGGLERGAASIDKSQESIKVPGGKLRQEPVNMHAALD